VIWNCVIVLGCLAACWQATPAPHRQGSNAGTLSKQVACVCADDSEHLTLSYCNFPLECNGCECSMQFSPPSTILQNHGGRALLVKFRSLLALIRERFAYDKFGSELNSQECRDVPGAVDI
jgi:hypothetical protein